MTFDAVFFFIMGLLFGSFANVVILRLPVRQSIVTPRSRCPSCKTMIPWYLNIPVVSWIVLRGRCQKCGVRISFRYPLIELLMAVLFVGLFLKVGYSWLLLEYLIFGFGLVVVSFIDFDHMILPDVFTLSGIVFGLVGSILNPERSFYSSLLGVLMGGGFLWAVAYIYLALRKEEGMGGGDIKLLAWIGALLGWSAIPFVILVSSVLGSFVGLIFAVRNPRGLRSSLPFGPYLALAALLYIFGGEDLGRWYISVFLPSLVDPN